MEPTLKISEYYDYYHQEKFSFHLVEPKNLTATNDQLSTCRR